MNAVVIVAGGSGRRAGGAIPKQYVNLGGKALVLHTLDRFFEFDPGIRVILVLAAGHRHLWKKISAGYARAGDIILAEGGEARSDSVRNGLKYVENGMIVGIHDAVRPFVTPETIRRCYASAANHGSGIPVVEMDESVRMVGPAPGPGAGLGLGSVPGLGSVSGSTADQGMGSVPGSTPDQGLGSVPGSTADQGLGSVPGSTPDQGLGSVPGSGSTHLDRSRLRRVQTPQVFRSELIREAYMHAGDHNYTDDASVYETLYRNVALVEGNPENIKITTPLDLQLAELMLGQG